MSGAGLMIASGARIAAEQGAVRAACARAVRAVMGRHARVAVAGDISDATDFVRDLGADSIDMVSLAMEMEEAIGREVPDDVAAAIMTFGDMVGAAMALCLGDERNGR